MSRPRNWNCFDASKGSQAPDVQSVPVIHDNLVVESAAVDRPAGRVLTAKS